MSDKHETTGGYSYALDLLTVHDTDGVVHHPICALVQYDDGWRMVARRRCLGDAVRTTSYVIDPMEALRNAGM